MLSNAASSRTSTRFHILALFLVSAGLILWELLLTRIYSVILFYHFAFMAVSVSMLGLSIGATWMYLAPVESNQVERRMAWMAVWAGLLAVLAMTVQLAMPVESAGIQVATSYLVITYLLSTLPFIPGGAFVCLALTCFAEVSTLYAADLAGAAAGCVLMPLLVASFHGPGLVFGVCACMAAAGWIMFRLGAPDRASLALALLVVAAAVGVLNVSQEWLRVRYRVSGPQRPPLYEGWNAFSRIVVNDTSARPFGWGISPAISPTLPPIQQLALEIDSGAATPITHFDGDVSKLVHLRYDITEVAHALRPGGSVCIIGPGGGRDILSALAFGQKSVLAVEVNPNIVYADNVVFGDFSGHLDRRPDVRFVMDEGRSALTRLDEKFDVIQASLVDTAAATAAGAYAFTENGLYTVEGWQTFLKHLKPGGVLSVSRFYFGSADWPVEIYRTLALATQTLRSMGVAEPWKYVMVVRSVPRSQRDPVATILVSNQPFTPPDVVNLQQTCDRLHGQMALSPDKSLDPNFDFILHNTDPAELLARYPLDITPCWDDRPYFFFHVRLQHILQGSRQTGFGGSVFNMLAVKLLATLTVTVTILGAALTFLPALWLEWRGAGRFLLGNPFFPIYFALIAVGFMLMEIGLMQRLSLLLGHPIYGFTVVLFGLLAATALGSFASAPLMRRVGRERRWLLVAVGAVVLLLMESVSSIFVRSAMGLETWMRIAASLIILAPSGVALGLPFPCGMDAAHQGGDTRTPWFWSINGAFSVIGSVVAMLLSIECGIHDTLLAAGAIYIVAAFFLLLAGRGVKTA